MRDKAPENVAQMLQSVAAVGLAMRTSTRPMWLFVQSDTAKEGFTAAVGLAWQRVVHAANYLCDPAVSCRSPDMKLQLMRPDMVKKLAKGIKKIAGAPPHGARQMSSRACSACSTARSWRAAHPRLACWTATLSWTRTSRRWSTM